MAESKKSKGSPVPMKGVHLPKTKSKKPTKVPMTTKQTVTATNKNM